MNINDFLSYLINEIIRVLAPNQNYHLDLDIEPIELPVKILSPLGIMVNELLSNSIKYAFRADSQLVISLKISNKNNMIDLIYKDNVPGFRKYKFL
jgi:two-component sensor histidine kinase